MSDTVDLARIERILLRHVKRLRAVSIVAVEERPPRGITGTQARIAAQQLVTRGELVLNRELCLVLPKPTKAEP